MFVKLLIWNFFLTTIPSIACSLWKLETEKFQIKFFEVVETCSCLFCQISATLFSNCHHYVKSAFQFFSFFKFWLNHILLLLALCRNCFCHFFVFFIFSFWPHCHNYIRVKSKHFTWPKTYPLIWTFYSVMFQELSRVEFWYRFKEMKFTFLSST